MSLNGYQRWGCDSLADDYNEDLIAYSGCDMEDAYQAGVKYRKRTESLEQENESLRGLIGANIRVIEQEVERRLNNVSTTLV